MTSLHTWRYCACFSSASSYARATRKWLVSEREGFTSSSSRKRINSFQQSSFIEDSRGSGCSPVDVFIRLDFDYILSKGRPSTLSLLLLFSIRMRSDKSETLTKFEHDFHIEFIPNEIGIMMKERRIAVSVARRWRIFKHWFGDFPLRD